MRKSNVILLWLTPIYIWIAQLTAYVHEYGHSFTAWALGFKANPLDIGEALKLSAHKLYLFLNESLSVSIVFFYTVEC